MSPPKDDATYAMFKDLMQIDESEAVDDQVMPDQDTATSSSTSTSHRQRKRPRISTPSPPSTTQALSPTHVAGSHSTPQDSEALNRDLINAMIFNQTDHMNDSPSPMSPEETEDFVNTAAQLAVCNLLLLCMYIHCTYIQLAHVLRPLGEREDDSLDSALLPGPDGFIHPFGLPSDNHVSNVHALANLSQHKKTLGNLVGLLDQLSDESTTTLIQSILLEVENGVGSLHEHIARIRSSNVTNEQIEELKADLLAIEARLSDWREQYPYSGPIQIDNRM